MFDASRSPRRLNVAGVARSSGTVRCECSMWNVFGRPERDLVLAGLMRWALLFHKVELQLMVHGEHVIIHELMSLRNGKGFARRVMEQLCLWADCARVVVELTPSDHWGADLRRLRRFYASFGFETNTEPPQSLLLRGELIRYPVKGRGHDA